MFKSGIMGTSRLLLTHMLIWKTDPTTLPPKSPLRRSMPFAVMGGPVSLLFHAFWHWNGKIIVDFFILLVLVTYWQFVLFCLFPTSFILLPLSLCASLDMAHRGVFRCVFLLCSDSLFASLFCFIFFPFPSPLSQIFNWCGYTHVILPCCCPITVGFAELVLPLSFDWLARLGFLNPIPSP